jgi:hypothetical protein
MKAYWGSGGTVREIQNNSSLEPSYPRAKFIEKLILQSDTVLRESYVVSEVSARKDETL